MMRNDTIFSDVVILFVVFIAPPIYNGEEIIIFKYPAIIFFTNSIIQSLLKPTNAFFSSVNLSISTFI